MANQWSASFPWCPNNNYLVLLWQTNLRIRFTYAEHSMQHFNRWDTAMLTVWPLPTQSSSIIGVVSVGYYQFFFLRSVLMKSKLRGRGGKSQAHAAVAALFALNNGFAFLYAGSRAGLSEECSPQPWIVVLGTRRQVINAVVIVFA